MSRATPPSIGGAFAGADALHTDIGGRWGPTCRPDGDGGMRTWGMSIRYRFLGVQCAPSLRVASTSCAFSPPV
eukprot:9468115-Pyramimonas_sp.AAC.1